MQPFAQSSLSRRGVQTLGMAGLFAVLAVPAGAQDLSELYQSLKPSVVTVTTRDRESSDESRPQRSLASGVIIDAEGLIITAAHVVQNADSVMVDIAGGEVIPAEVISSVPSADIALIRLNSVPHELAVATLGNSSSVQVGQQILIIGAPFGLEHSLSVGHVSRRSGEQRVAGGELMEFIQTDASINRGNSGAPMFNLKGEVIGIVSSIVSSSGGFEGIGFAAAINPTRRILLDSPSFWTGFDGVFLDEELSRILNVPQKSGLLVQRVASGSLADKAGLIGGSQASTIAGQDILLGGDIILTIQGVSCEVPHDFSRIREELVGLKRSPTFSIEILRGGRLLTLFGATQDL